VLGLAISVKLTPLLLVAMLLGRGRWRLSLVAVVTAGAMLLAPALWLGTTVARNNLDYWAEGVASFSRQQDLYSLTEAVVGFDFANQSVRMLVWRVLRPLPADAADRPAWGYHDVFEVEPATARTIIWIVQGALLGIAVWACGWRAPPRDSLAAWVEVALTLTLMLLLSPITWKAHLVALMLPCALLAADGLLGGVRCSWRSLVAFVACTALLNRATLGEAGEDLQMAYYVHTLGMIVIWGALVRLRLRLHLSLPPVSA
jgi:hypothetical protein